MDKHLHIVCFTPPYPPDFGGLTDIFYKLIWLHHAGIKIHLHCFTEANYQPPELKEYCAEIYYYPRKTGFSGFSFFLPYIVSSRRDPTLSWRLLQDNYPILVEGVHSSFLLNDPGFAGRIIILRLHNVEHIYYRHLMHSCRSLFRRAYYACESQLLKRYEREIAHRPAAVLGVSKDDVAYYSQVLGASRIAWMPVFTGFSKLNSEWSRPGSYCLYHGNLSVAENEKAVCWLMKEVFGDLLIPLVIAGKSPSKRLQRYAGKFPLVELIASPSEEKIRTLIAGASCHVLPSFNATGVKLKLINALFNGRHCITNTAGAAGSGLAALCHIADTPAVFREKVLKLHPLALSADEAVEREKTLLQVFNPAANVQRIIEWMESDPVVSV